MGADALIPSRDGKTEFVLICGIKGGLKKLKEDCRRLKETHPELKEIVFATTQPVTEIKKTKWRESVYHEFGIRLHDVIQREWIATELEKPASRWLCEDYLHIVFKESKDLAEILPRICIAANKLLGTWKDDYGFDNHPLIDLLLEEQPDQKKAREQSDQKEVRVELHLSDFPRHLKASDRCYWITGAPGAGKTFSLIKIGIVLTQLNSLIPILVPLRDLSDRRDKPLEWIASEPSFQEQEISESMLANAASAGKLLLLLNGWDEVARNARIAAAEAINAFLRQIPSSAVIITSRQPPENDFEFSKRIFRIKPLSGNDIRKALRQAAIKDAERQADFILTSGPLAEIASIPLFLQEIIQEVKMGNELPLGRQAMLRRMVERAVKEHQLALEQGEIREHAFRYLTDLSQEMTQRGSTSIPDKEARVAISNTARKLKEEALLGEIPAPPDILGQLRAGHLLVSTSSNEVAFTHQLIQEHFAAIWITSFLRGAMRKEDLVFLCQRLADYQWEQPLFLALEDLAKEGRGKEISVLLDWFRVVDFEAACRMVGVVSDFWSQVRDLFKPVIHHLSLLEDVNARWLAAQCAAATGQAEFQDLVWAALEGHPKGSSDCFEAISSTFFLRALGAEFAEKLLQVPDEEFRFTTLKLAGRSPSMESLHLAESLAMYDPALKVRLLSFRQLFRSGRRGWLRYFLREAKIQGWSLSLLRVLNTSPQCTTVRFRKFIRHYLEKQTSIEERMNTLKVWSELDPPGASTMVRVEYDRFAGLLSSSSEEVKFRQFCLRNGALDKPQWAIHRAVCEILSSDDTAMINNPDSELIPCLAKLVQLAPVDVAECLLRAIVEGTHEPAVHEKQSNLRDVLQGVVNRKAIIEAVVHPDFAELSIEKLSLLLHALSTDSPGGMPNLLQSAPKENLSAYRKRLFHWLSLLSPLDPQYTFDRALCATLISEVGHSDDADTLYGLLREDEACVSRRIEERKQKADDYLPNDRTSAQPSSMARNSYSNWYIAALANIPGRRCREIMVELLSHPAAVGTAAYMLADHAGAAATHLSINIYYREPRFDLVYERRSARKFLGNPASSYEALIKEAIDQHLTRRHDYLSPELSKAFCAVARFASAGCEAWILDRLERHFPKAGAESIFECMTLAGCLLPGRRILPFVQRTITAVLGEAQENRDQIHSVSKALVSLFFSDAPSLAIQLLAGEAAWFLKSHEMKWLLDKLYWEQSDEVDEWLEQLLSVNLECAETIDAIWGCLVRRAKHRNDHTALIALAHRMAQVGFDYKQTYSAWQIISESAVACEDFRNSLFSLARIAKSASEAAGWLRLISGIGTASGVKVVLELAERFEEQLGVVKSITPQQKGTSLTFHGWFYLCRGLYYRSPDTVTKLHEFVASPNHTLRVAAERALLWLERERICLGKPPSGQRFAPYASGSLSDKHPWYLRLHL
jgi:hypothetical protein